MSTSPITLPREITYEWSPELVKLGARRFIIRQAGRKLLVFLGIISALVATLAFMGEGSWWLLAIIALTPPFLWLLYYYRVTRIRYELPDPRVVVRVESESITFQTSEYQSTIKWSGIKKVWIFPDVLLLFTYTKHNYSALPVAPLGEELKSYIESKVRECGGEVA